MLKIKPTRLLIHACLLFAFYACTTKNEVPQPVVDTARVDALRTELMALQQKVLGAQKTTSSDSLSITQLQTEIATLKAYLERIVSYTVDVNSFLFQPLSGATVELSQGGKIISGKTSSAGSVTFANLYAGVVTVTVDLTGFARLVFRADIRNNIDDASLYSTTSKVLMLPLGGTTQADSCMTIQNWKLYANYTMVDDTLGGPQYWSTASTPSKALPAGPNPSQPTVSYSAVINQPITVFLNQNSFIDGTCSSNVYAVPIGFTGWDAASTGRQGNGQVVSVTYENARWTVAAAGSNGTYTIKLPATDINNINYSSDINSYNVFNFSIEFGEFIHDYIQYTDGTIAFIIKNPIAIPPPPTYASTYIYRIGSSDWSSVQSTSLTSTASFFFSGNLK
jgi:hypothetical protein